MSPTQIAASTETPPAYVPTRRDAFIMAALTGLLAAGCITGAPERAPGLADEAIAAADKEPS